jgi:hypothetical protein
MHEHGTTRAKVVDKDAGGTARERPAYAHIVSHMLCGCFAGAR